MTPGEVISALELPASCRVDQRVPKKMLIDNGAPTGADKRLIVDDRPELTRRNRSELTHPEGYLMAAGCVDNSAVFSV